MAAVLTVDELEERVHVAARAANIRPHDWQEFFTLLDRLKQHHLGMYAHSLRVGLYAYGLAALEERHDLKLPLMGGCGHDIGKCHIPKRLLDAKNLSPAGYRRIQRHSHAGYEDLKERFLYTGFIAGLHHHYRPDGYGIDLKVDAPFPLSDKIVDGIKQVSIIVMTADFFDAVTTRRDQRSRELLQDPHNADELRRVLAQYFPDRQHRVNWLLGHRIGVA